ncbi:MAG TPA: PAS domain S-box protein [Hyphomicrobiaceae bacterium]
MQGTRWPPGDIQFLPLGRGTGWVLALGLGVSTGIAYYLAARLGLALCNAPGVAVFWPAAGIALGVLLAWGPGARLPVAGAAIAATAFANFEIGRNPWLAVLFGFVNAGQALLTAWLIERTFGRTFRLESVPQVLGLLVVGAIGAAMAAACAAVAVSLVQPAAPLLVFWRLWSAACLLGIVTVAPLLIGIGDSLRDPPPPPELVEGAASLATLAALCVFVLSLPPGFWATAVPVAFAFPLLLWVVVRCRPVFAAAGTFVMALSVIWSVTFNMGHFGDAGVPRADRILAAQTVVLAGALLALVLAALFAERRRSLAALGESDTRLRSILDAANVIAWDIDLTRNTVHSAGPVARLLDRSKESIPNDFAAMVETIYPEDRDAVLVQFWQAVSDAVAYRLEFRLNPAGMRWVTAEGSIERDALGRPVRVRGITHDITERKKAELALAERDAQLGLAGKAARVGSFAIDIETGRVQNSPGYAAIHGLAEGTEEFPREEWRTRVHPDDLGRLDAIRSRMFAERRHEHNMEYRIVAPDGGVRWIESRGLVSYDAEGRPTRIIGVNIDMTERKRVLTALEESEARYRALYDDNPSMYFTVDALGAVLSVNEFGARQLGYAPAELVGRSVLQLIHEEDREAARRHLASCAETPESVAAAELRKVRRDGSIIWVREAARAVRQSAGQQTVILVVCEEITERKRAEEQQSLLVAELDHRVKNVLATVAVVASRTSEHTGSTSDFIEALDRRLQSMGEAHSLLSRNRWRGVSLADLVAQELAPYATSGDATVEGATICLPPAATQAVAMVLHELATNAAKYGALSTPHGRVSVRWRRLSDEGGPARLRLEWQEDDGPAVTAPAQPGYGTSVIRDLIPYELGGTVELEFNPNGVRCTIEIAVEKETGRLAAQSRGGGAPGH